ncbi:unnamed protein product [Vitrella brassicaformis CCMP3155]|uniref:FAD-binding domain-containing protein n=2 Tax=Vitrella brassicaformis TaxID=1169539 RepID=A0A0G4GFR7_VITBC|nr:unnamed protein product [Vitrella brassicaformis CCMP3155]|eukprot:CEM28377.1 unnamed protein product [Vitrella brassicaformis CCMP3155]
MLSFVVLAGQLLLLIGGAVFGSLVLLLLLVKWWLERPLRQPIGRVRAGGPFKGQAPDDDTYEVCIVGAGPAGSSCAYFSVKGGVKTLLLERKTFPRDKYCGDGVCTPAINILEEMGVMKTLKENNEVKFADAGGLVSPAGLSYIGASVEKLGNAAACAVKRLHLDMRMAFAARDAGASLLEEQDVIGAEFDDSRGIWTVKTEAGASYKARLLVCADGAPSRLATKLGYCTEAPKGISSRAFISGKHNTNFDGVCFYLKGALPGYCAIFRHPNDELNFCYYLIPCGKEGMCGDVSEKDLPRLHNYAIKEDPFVSAAIGKQAKIEPMKAAALRLARQGVSKSYGPQLLIVGDAAGQCDPLTGEGIHTAMIGGKQAALTIIEMSREGDYSEESCKVYEDRWLKEFGHDFPISVMGSWLLWKCPMLIDATAAEMQRQGDKMLALWAELMTCMKPKTYFLHPSIALPLGVAVVRRYLSTLIFGEAKRQL